MPRTKLPPTPATSTGPAALEDLSMEKYTLPPSAITSPPLSPIISRKRTLSGDLPPPPSRARKIIQMKPNAETKAVSPKRKAPSATSAAGRKIARKTAHSIIERRRRSKMNEEFGVLKDMIPACCGVEMHKLAILQAGIEYVRYLQGCVERLSDGNQAQKMAEFAPASRTNKHQNLDEDEDENDEDENRGSVESVTGSSAQVSPAILPQQSSAGESRFTPIAPAPRQKRFSTGRQIERFEQRTDDPARSAVQKTYSTSPPVASQTGISPAFNAIHFSPDLSRQQWKQSPNILPLPQAAMAMPLPGMQLPGVGSEEATATAALMMLNNDRRNARGGMSVKDLLSY